jgi:hypothetical protein
MRLLLITLLLLSSHSYSSYFDYTDRDHTKSEVFIDQSIVFSGHLSGYLLTQGDAIDKEGSWSKYNDHFLDFKFDNDNTNWNYFGHTYTGSQVYLFYRARGYTKSRSFALSFLSSLWFEAFIENYTEQPSVQDTFNTPVFGTALGYVSEKVSVYFLNSESIYIRALGRIINPFSFLVEQKNVAFVPIYRDPTNYSLMVSFNYD